MSAAAPGQSLLTQKIEFKDQPGCCIRFDPAAKYCELKRISNLFMMAINIGDDKLFFQENLCFHSN